MPTYEYRCASCGQHIEVVQSFTDEALTECGACGGALKKVFGSVGIVFKGSGFYKTDSRGGTKKAGESKPAESTSTAASSEGKATSGSSDSPSSTASSPPAGKSEAKSA